MKEAQIRKKIKEICIKNNWLYWFPPKVKFYETDILGFGDVIIVDKKGNVKLIQLTTVSNISTRIKKIKEKLVGRKIKIGVEVWGWSQKKKQFKIIKVGSKQ